MIRLNVIKSFLIKEIKQLLRDPRMRLAIFLPPLVMALINGYAISNDVGKIRMAVLDQDKTPQSQTFIDKFTSSGYFLPYSYLGSAKEASLLLDKGEVEVFLQIERGFSKGTKSDKVSHVQIIIDGTDSSRAAVIVSYVNEIASNYSMEFLRSRIRNLVLSKEVKSMTVRDPIQLKERYLYNPTLASINYFLPGLLCLIMSMTPLNMTSMSIVKEKELGNIEQILVSPVSTMELIIGKSLPFFLLSFVHLLMVMMVAMFWFKVPFKGNFFFLLVASSSFIFAAIGMGLYIAAISRTQQQAILAGFMYILPMVIFSGFAFPIYAMPKIIQYATYINPLRYFMTIFRAVFLKGVGMDVLWPDLLAMFGLGVMYFYLSMKRFKRGLE
jgi:ABC-2 type transport system permease protein